VWLVQGQDFKVVFRTFGTDIKDVVHEMNLFATGQHPLFPEVARPLPSLLDCSKAYSVHRFPTPAESVPTRGTLSRVLLNPFRALLNPFPIPAEHLSQPCRIISHPLLGPFTTFAEPSQPLLNAFQQLRRC
jgi:hypothetical protein